MYPKECCEEEWIDLLEGLEQMAAHLKQQPKRRSSTRVRRMVNLIRTQGIAGVVRRRESRRLGLDIALPRDPNEPEPAWKKPESYFSSERVAVYMAMFGGYDQVQEPVIHPDNIDYYLISDAEIPVGSRWQRINPDTILPMLPPEVYGDPVLSNRWCKMHPHLLFPQHALSVYLDSNFLIVSDLTALTACLGYYPVAMFKHKQRTCVYKEIEACIIKGKAPRKMLEAHERLLREHGVPENYGLLEAPIIVRRHADPRCMTLMDAWWEAFLAGSRRDQIALADALWSLGIDPATVGTLGADYRDCDIFVMIPHKQRDTKGGR